MSAIPQLADEDLALLELKPADSTTGETTVAPNLESGTPITDFTPFNLNQDQKLLVAGEGKIDRSAILHGFAIKLIDLGKPREDVVATILENEALWQYCLSHRNDDPDKAALFAIEEVDRAYGKSLTGKRDALVGYNPEWGAPKPDAPQDAPNAAVTSPNPKKTLRLTPMAELFHMAGPIDWLIRGYFESDALIQIFGPPASYKSFVADEIAVCVASGLDWHGHQVVRQGLVVVVCGEGLNGVSRRFRAICQRRVIDPETLPLVVSNMAVGLTEGVAELKAAIEEASAIYGQPVLIIIDTLARNFGAADENSTEHMNKFIDSIDTLRGNASVLVVHHTGHNNQERERGSSALRGAVDANYRVEYSEEQHGVVIEPCKMKDAELPPSLLLMPKVVELDNVKDDTGAPVTSVVLETSADQHQARVADLYKRYPKLASSNERKKHLPKLFEIIYDEPGISQRALADKLEYGLSSVNSLVTELRKYHLIEVDSLTLTQLGRVEAGILCPIQIALRESLGRVQKLEKMPWINKPNLI